METLHSATPASPIVTADDLPLLEKRTHGGFLVKTSFLLIAITVAVKLLGFARDQFIAFMFGSGPIADAYYLALTFVVGLVAIVGGTFSTALVPVLTAFWTERRLAGWTMTRVIVAKYLWIVVGVAAVVVAGGSSFIVGVLGPGLPSVTRPLAVQFIRAFGVGFVFWAFAPVLSGILNSRGQFVVAGFGPIALNGAILAGLVLAGRGPGVGALAAATVFGMCAQFLFLAPFVVRSWWRDHHERERDNEPEKPLLSESPSRVWALARPIFAVSVLSQIPSIVDKAVASNLPVGSVSVLAFALKLMQLPLGLFVGGVATVFYTSLSDAWAHNNEQKAADEVGLALGITLLVALPAAAGLVTLARPIVQFVFQHGRFDASAARSTSHVLLYYCVGLPMVGGNLVLLRNAFAGERTAPAVRGYVAMLLVNGAGDIVFSRIMGPAGIAMASSLGAATLALFLIMSWPRTFRMQVFEALTGSLGSVVPATASMIAVILSLSALVSHHPFWIRLSLPGVAGLVAYLIYLLVSRPREILLLFARVRPTSTTRKFQSHNVK